MRADAAVTEFLVAGLVILSGAVAWIVRTIISNGNRLTRLEERPSGAASVKEIAALREAVSEFKLCVERNFVRHDHWVPTMSRIEGMLEEQGKLLVRLEERQKAHDD